MLRESAGMKNHNDGVNEKTIEQLVASAIQKGTFSPTAHARQAYARQAKMGQTKASRTQSGHAPSALDSVEILNQTPLETHQYFLSRGYRCVTSVTADFNHHRPTLKETYSWDEQLILSVWRCLQIFEDSAESSPQEGLASSTLRNPLLKWLKTAAQLSPHKRLERFFNDFLFVRLRNAPMVIFIDSLEPFTSNPYALETLFTWIWRCYQQLEQQNDFHPLQFVVLGKVVI